MKTTILVSAGVFFGVGFALALLVSPIAVIAPFGFGFMLLAVGASVQGRTVRK